MSEKQPNTDPFEFIQSQAKSTPDFHQLNKGPYDEHLVLVTGLMRRYKKFNHVLKGCNFYGEGSTWANSYVMKKGPNETEGYKPEPFNFEFPEVKGRENFFRQYPSSKKFQMTSLGKIEGEVWGVPLRTLTKIDEYQMNGDAVDRVQRWITFTKNVQHPNAKCFLYTVNWSNYESFYQNGELENCNSFNRVNQEGKKSEKTYYFT